MNVAGHVPDSHPRRLQQQRVAQPPQTALPAPRLNAHLPPHLHEVCQMLALGLVRLRSRAAEDLARDAEEARGHGDVRLYSTAQQRRHANPKRKGVA